MKKGALVFSERVGRVVGVVLPDPDTRPAEHVVKVCVALALLWLVILAALRMVAPTRRKISMGRAR